MTNLLDKLNAEYQKHVIEAKAELAKKYPTVAALVKKNDRPFQDFKLLDLVRRLEQIQPERIIELGSGTTTLVFDWWQRYHECEVLSIDESVDYQTRTVKRLPDGSRVKVRHSPKVINGGVVCYQASLTSQLRCDLLYVDGPSNKIGDIEFTCVDSTAIEAKHLLFDIRRTSVLHYREEHQEAYFEPSAYMALMLDPELVISGIHHSYFRTDD